MTERFAANKPALDEESFTKLLAAAYVMQEHQDRMKEAEPAPKFPPVSSEPTRTHDGIPEDFESVLAVLARLQPELQKFAGQTAGEAVASAELCRACGHEFAGNEEYCGVCGASRRSGQYPGAELQSKWATLWEKHMTGAVDGSMPVFRKTPPKEIVPHADKLPFELEGVLDLDEIESPEDTEPGDDIETADQSLTKSERASSEQELQASPGKSASAARHWLNITSPREWWSELRDTAFRRPGDASLTLACVILSVTLGWALWPRTVTPALASAQPPGVKHRPRPEPPKLSLMEKALVAVGLAVPPPTPQYTGDPTVKVWEDTQNGLYYCPDADLYGSTPKGRYATQADAQLDAYDPAFHHFCE